MTYVKRPSDKRPRRPLASITVIVGVDFDIEEPAKWKRFIRKIFSRFNRDLIMALIVTFFVTYIVSTKFRTNANLIVKKGVTFVYCGVRSVFV